jgi:hypothetical protein
MILSASRLVAAVRRGKEPDAEAEAEAEPAAAAAGAGGLAASVFALDK